MLKFVCSQVPNLTAPSGSPLACLMSLDQMVLAGSSYALSCPRFVPCLFDFSCCSSHLDLRRLTDVQIISDDLIFLGSCSADRRATARTTNFVEPCSIQQKKDHHSPPFFDFSRLVSASTAGSENEAAVNLDNLTREVILLYRVADRITRC